MAFIEDGKWRNKAGDFVHPDMIRIDKQLEDELVEGLVKGSLETQKMLAKFKADSFEQCYAFNDLLRDKYDLEKIVSKSGAVTLKSFDGTNEVSISISKIISFDQKLTLAKEKIDEYLDEKTRDGDAVIKTLITRIFDVKNGKVDSKLILSLRSYDIPDKKWKDAMEMINDAIEIAGTKSYIRFRHRKNNEVDGDMDNILLNIANVSSVKIEELE